MNDKTFLHIANLFDPCYKLVYITNFTNLKKEKPKEWKMKVTVPIYIAKGILSTITFKWIFSF
jgi:hypothetical protein